MTTWADQAAGREPVARDPYRTLGVSPEVSDQGLRRAYRRLALLHHPDHNAGSPVAGSRFAEIQSAYDTIVRLRRGGSPTAPEPGQCVHPSRAPASNWADPGFQSRIAEVERDYAAQRQSQLGDLDLQDSPYAPRVPRASLRERLTDWFRDA